MPRQTIYEMSFNRVYPLLVAKAERKGRTQSEVDEAIRWLTGYEQAALQAALADGISYEDFFAEAPRLNPLRSSIKGVICGVRIEDIEDPLMREIRYLDKLVDDLAKGKVLDSILLKFDIPG